MKISCDEFCSNSPSVELPKPEFEVQKDLMPSDEWDFVETNLDRIEGEISPKVNSGESVNSGEMPVPANCKKISKPLNAFNTKITVTQDATTVELFRYNGCSGDFASGDPAGGENSRNAGTGDSAGSEVPVESQHPNTIRRYVAAMLAFFSNLRVEYQTSQGIKTRKLPVFYANREKLLTITDHEFSELMNGNTNYLPRASLVLDSMTYDQNRQNNKNVPAAKELTFQSLSAKSAFAYVTSAPSPYNISVRLNIITRGMNDAMMLVEQVSSFFNPFYTFKLVEEQQENSVRLQLDGITFEQPEFDQFSDNEVLVEFNFTLFGNMFKPRTKEYIIDTITMNI